MTPQTLITDALRNSGVIGQGQAARPLDVQQAFRRVNGMLSQWQRKRWLVYHLIEVSLVSTGAVSYSIGAGGDFDTPRPDRLESAFFRQIIPSSGVNRIDYPLDILPSREDYNLIALKTMGTWPECIFYDSGFPLGAIYVWPVPAASNYSIHLSLKANLTRFESLNQTIEFPPEYEEALLWNLAARLRPAYQLPPDPTVIALAKDSLNLIRGANTQISTLHMPNVVLGNGRMYNVYSDGN